jgi:hypothetical protein
LSTQGGGAVTPTREETLQTERDAAVTMASDLRAELMAARQNADNWKVCAEMERDAALEEAAQSVLASTGGWVSDPLPGAKTVKEALANGIRALKSKP